MGSHSHLAQKTFVNHCSELKQTEVPTLSHTIDRLKKAKSYIISHLW